MADASATVRGNVLRFLSERRSRREIPGNQTELAEALGITSQALSHTLKSDKSLTLRTVENLAEALGVSVVELVTPPGASLPASGGHFDDVPSAFEAVRVVRWILKTPEGKAFARELIEAALPTAQ